MLVPETLVAIIVVGILVVPRYTSYPVAPETAFQERVTEVVVIKLPDTGPIFPEQPGGVGGVGGVGLVPPFLLQEFTNKPNTSKPIILFLKFISSS